MFWRCYSSFTDPAATSCANHYSAGRYSNGEYYIKVSGVTFKVSAVFLLLFWFSLLPVALLGIPYWGFNSWTFTPKHFCQFVNLRNGDGDRAIVNLIRGD